MGEEESKESIGRAIEAISSLISLSHSIKSFNVKWQLIRTKLEELYSGLAALHNLHSGFDPSLSTLISAILASLTDCFDLATTCVNVSYSGKLLMQSDLDLIAGRFDRHSRNLSRIYSAGILAHGFAIVVSKPAANACKEDIRFYIRDLLTRMKIGDLVMKKQALVKLNESMEEDDRYAKAVIEIDSMVIVLVEFLDSEIAIQEESAKAVLFLAGFGSYRSVLIRSGVIGPLVRALENGSEEGREASARCLMKLTENSENAWSLSAHGGVAALLKICSCCSRFSGALIAASCGVLRNLVGVEEIRRYMIEEDDTVTTFIKLLRSKEEMVQVNSIDLLLSLCDRDEQTRETLVREGGIQELVAVLSSPDSLSSSKSKEIALRAIDNLCLGSVVCLNTLLSCKFLDHLLNLLRNGEVSVQESALKVASRLCSLQEEVKKVMGEVGFMSELVKFLDSKSLDVREMASVGLYCLISVPRNRKKFAQDDFNISYILQLLDHEDGSNDTKLLISILMSLTSCNSARRKIANSGYLKSIEKLAETEDSDAKKLVKKLSMNRFRSMLSGIWHS